MRDSIIHLLPWGLSLLTIWMNIKVGDRSPRAWLLGIAGQCVWLVWILAAGAWGFLPLNLTLFWVYVRNHRKWQGTSEVRGQR